MYLYVFTIFVVYCINGWEYCVLVEEIAAEHYNDVIIEEEIKNERD